VVRVLELQLQHLPHAAFRTLALAFHSASLGTFEHGKTELDVCSPALPAALVIEVIFFRLQTSTAKRIASSLLSKVLEVLVLTRSFDLDLA